MRQTRPVADKGRPILLDLNGNGIEIAGIDRAPALVTGDDGLQHRTAWAGVGDGVLFFDAGMDGRISESREYVFTEWDPTAKDDMAALRARFDTNSDGVLNSADADWAKFKVMVTKPDGSQTALTLAELGITQIALKTDATAIRLEDGSTITGLSSFVKNGVVQTAGAVALVSEAEGHWVEATVDGATTTHVTKDAAGHVLARQTSEVQSLWTPDRPGYTVTTTNRYDDTGDGSFDRAQVVARVIAERNRRTKRPRKRNPSFREQLIESILDTQRSALVDKRLSNIMSGN